MAQDMGVPYLGDIELDPRLGQSCDAGRSFISDFPDSRVSKAYQRIIHSEFSCMQQKGIVLNRCFIVIVVELKEKLSPKETTEPT